MNAETPTPSRSAQECAAGVTTSAWSPDRTVKCHEPPARSNKRDEIVCSASKRKMQKHGIKSLCDNTWTTIQNRSGKLADNVSNNNALLRRLKAKGNVRPFGGGNVIL